MTDGEAPAEPIVAEARHGRRRRLDTGGRRVKARQLPWSRWTNGLKPIELLSADEIEAIHQASLEVLETVGVAIMLPEARAILKAAGCKVDEDLGRVYFDRHLVEAMMAKVPSRIGLHARNPAHDLMLGGDQVCVATCVGPPNVVDLDRGRRNGNWADYCELLKLAQALNVVHLNAGYAPEPIDVDINVRHLETTRAQLTLTDKVAWTFTFAPRRMHDVFEMVRIARGVTAEEQIAKPGFHSLINTNSPLQIDQPMLHGIIEMAKLGQPLCITPFAMSGASMPVTLAGTLVVMNAEILAGTALAQLVRPGAPIVYGAVGVNVDLRSGAPVYGSPEFVKMQFAGGQLARRYGMPLRASPMNSSPTTDAQAAYETAIPLWGILQSGVNLMLHGLGWVEGGLAVSYEKYILDAEMLQVMREVTRPITVDAATLAVQAIRDVGPGGHFFAHQHTLDRYETAFYLPLLSDWRSWAQWKEDGAKDALQRANRLWKDLLAEYVPPPLDPARAEELDAFVARRTEEGGAPLLY